MPLFHCSLRTVIESWGGPPGPRPTPPSARSRASEPDFIGEERVRGTRADQGVRPTIEAEFPAPLCASLALALCILSAPLVSAPPALTAEEQAVLSGISPDSLRA